MNQVERVAVTLVALAEDIKDAPHESFGLALLKCASKLLETSAYELARTHDSAVTAQVILQSSESQKLYERLADPAWDANKATKYDA